MTNSYDPNASLGYSYDTEEVDAEIQRRKEAAEREEQAALEEEQAAQVPQPVEETPPPVEEAPKPKPKKDDKGYDVPLLGAFKMLGDMQETGSMGGTPTRSFEVGAQPGAGVVDLLMDGVSMLMPALQKPADWWDEQTGRKTETDPMKKAWRDVGGLLIATFATGGVVGAGARLLPGAANLSARTKLFGQAAANLGIDAALSGVSDVTREPGNIATALEAAMPNGVQIPWASRDNDSPDATFAKNMLENMLLGGSAELLTAFFAAKGGNIITPRNGTAAKAVIEQETLNGAALQAAGGDPVIAEVSKVRSFKKSAQLEEAKKVLEADPDGVNGYNAFVNEPAEPVARITLDEDASAINFKADQARIQNNVGTFNGRSRPIIDNDAINALSRADAATRADILAKVEGDLGAEFDLEVGGQKLTKLEVEEAINNLYDTALVTDEAFPDAVKSFRNLELKIIDIGETISDAGQQEILMRTSSRLIDAVSPYKQRASAAIQTQTAGSVSDIARNIDLMADVQDTSRLQELIFPRLRTMLKEAETSKTAQKISKQVNARLNAKAGTLEGALGLDREFMDSLIDQYDSTVRQAGIKVDKFIDELEVIAKDNPSYLRPLYRMWARTNGDIDTLYKMQKYTDNRLGIIRKAFYDGNSDMPSVVLKELQATRMSNILNGLAPAKAWIGNATSLVMKPMTIFAGAVPATLKGDIKPIQRAWYTFSGGLETFNRARKMMLEEIRFANANPDAAMARGRKDYNFSDAAEPGANDWRKALSDFEEFEELSETWGPGKKAIWNLTKTAAYWNRKSWNRWGTHQMYGADGFVKSMMASANARATAFDQLASKNNGVFDPQQFRSVERQLYADAFDESGLLRDGYAKFASEEVALNADIPLLQAAETLMDTFPIMKSIFMFPSTRVNQFGVVQTFDPTGLLGGWMDRSGKVIRAKTRDEINEVLDMHGMRGATDAEFQQLKSEYIGRKMMTSGVVMTAAIAAANGRLVGSGPHDPAENKRWRNLGGQPFTVNLGTAENPDFRSYEQLPTPVRAFLSITADVTQMFAGVKGDVAQDWYKTLAASLSANITNDLFGSEIEALSGLVSLEPGAWNRYTANMMDSMIPGTAIRGVMSSTLASNLQDVENNWLNYLANRNRWIPSVNAALSDEIDIFTGEPVGQGSSPLEIIASKVLPGFKSKAGMEPWRLWMLNTGWDGLSKPMVNKQTQEELTPPVRQWINNWIGTNLSLDKKVEELMMWDDKKWDKNIKEYVKKKGFKSQKDFPAKELFVYEYLDDMVQDAYNQAWAAYEAQNEELADIKSLKEARDQALNNGLIQPASELADRIAALRSSVK